ncbi:hypothetical protein KI387_032168, partial [Taxus chinensis]
GDGLRVATGSYSDLFRVFGCVPGSDEATMLEASKSPNRRRNMQASSKPSRSLTSLTRVRTRRGSCEPPIHANPLVYIVEALWRNSLSSAPPPSCDVCAHDRPEPRAHHTSEPTSDEAQQRRAQASAPVCRASQPTPSTRVTYTQLLTEHNMDLEVLGLSKLGLVGDIFAGVEVVDENLIHLETRSAEGAAEHSEGSGTRPSARRRLQ